MATIPDNPQIARLYEHVPQDQIQRLLDFRSRCPYQEMEIAGRRWPYIDTETGEQPIFIFAGGTTVAEVSFNTIEHLAQNYRVIAPDYPPIDTLAELFAGYIRMLDRLGVGQFVLMGGSYGGWIAQSFVRDYPERVTKLVLAAIGPPNPENSSQLARMLGWLRLTPTPILRALLNRSFARLAPDDSADPRRLLTLALVNEIMRTRVTRNDILAALRRLVDQTAHATFAADDLADWPGSILMVMGSADPSTPPEKRAALARLYPDARMVVFEGADHTVSLTHSEGYYGAIDEFLAG
jgi:3-oxoadipate enol-lactonase